MDKSKSTILIVSADNINTISFNIATKHILNFKKYLIASSAFIFIFISFLTFLIVRVNMYSSEKISLTNQIKTMENDVKLIDSLYIKTKINNIESRILDINNYLKERGTDKTPNAGGEKDSARTDVSIYDYYEKFIDKLYSNTRRIPIGYPWIGELKSDYGYRSNPFGGRGSEFHKGMDLKGNTGDTVRCTADGTIIKADWDKGYGKCVAIKHNYGIECIFGHLSEFNVVQGQTVKAGDIIGFIGSTGRSTGPHLHYEIRQNGIDINPHNFLNIN